jgi:hypothetical protein
MYPGAGRCPRWRADRQSSAPAYGAYPLVRTMSPAGIPHYLGLALESSAHGGQQRVSAKTMKKTAPKSRADADTMRDEYAFDYSKVKPNRFAARMRRPVIAVVLEPDVASGIVKCRG